MLFNPDLETLKTVDEPPCTSEVVAPQGRAACIVNQVRNIKRMSEEWIKKTAKISLSPEVPNFEMGVPPSFDERQANNDNEKMEAEDPKEDTEIKSSEAKLEVDGKVPEVILSEPVSEIKPVELKLENSIIISHSPNELKLKFAPIDLILNEISSKSFKSLSIVDIPSTEEVLKIIKDNDFVNEIKNSACDEIFTSINDKMDFLKTSEWTKLSGLYDNKQKSMMIAIDGDEKFQVGWKAAGREKMMNLPIGGEGDKRGEKDENVEKFVVEYLRDCFKVGHSGEL